MQKFSNRLILDFMFNCYQYGAENFFTGASLNCHSQQFIIKLRVQHQKKKTLILQMFVSHKLNNHDFHPFLVDHVYFLIIFYQWQF